MWGGRLISNYAQLRLPHLQRKRSCTGSAMSEFGPAIWVLLIFFFLPLIDVMCVGVSYAMCIVLNSNQVHEAALLRASASQLANSTVKEGIPNEWLNGMGKFVKIVGKPDTQITYSAGQQETGADQITDQIVTVSTTVVCSPFLPIPLPLVNCPGLNGPMTFQITSQRQMENPDDAHQ
jgi:hypothetical protein